MSQTENKWTNGFLDSFRQKSDPFADQTVKAIIEEGSPAEMKRVFNHLVENTDVDMTQMPPKVKAFFKETAILPPWADNNLIIKGEAVFSLYGPELSMLLLCKSLPASYACKKGAEVLYQTGRLQEHGGNLKMFTRRLMETSQFVVNVMAPGGLGPKGNGIVSAQKVRLMHASIRYFILNRGGWDSSLLGLPINQEDMAGTLMAFAAYPLEGMEQIGVHLSTEQQNAYMHLWACVGHIMGLEAELIPKNYSDGVVLGNAILDAQKGESEAGKALGKACIDFMKDIVPVKLFDFFPEMFVNYLLGDELSGYIGVKKHHGPAVKIMETVLHSMMGELHTGLEHSDKIKKIASVFNRHLLQGMINYYNEDKKTNFYIPPSLKKNWLQEDLQSQWVDLASTPTLAGFRLALQKSIKK